MLITLRLWTVKWYSSLRTDHKILNNDAHNEDESTKTWHTIPLIRQNSKGESH